MKSARPLTTRTTNAGKTTEETYETTTAKEATANTKKGPGRNQTLTIRRKGERDRNKPTMNQTH